MHETTFCELRKKEVINLDDGRRLGRIIDVAFEVQTARVLGFILPGTRKFFNFFRVCDDIFVPLQSILKIGEDVILVELCGCVGPAVCECAPLGKK